MQFFNKKKTKEQGFTLLELLLVTAIFVIITGIVLARYPDFSSTIVLENVAHDIALSVRQAQVFGSSARSTGADSFSSRYGLHFDLNSLESRKDFILFAESSITGDYRYTGEPSCTNECIDRYTIQSNDRIFRLYDDYNSDAPNSLQSLDITFTRPEPDATFKGMNISGEYNNFSNNVGIEIISGRGDKKVIIVWSSGQISVSDAK